MRYLFLLRGIPASGKSTFIKEKNLEPYTLSSDQIRLQFESPVLDVDGNFCISQKNDRYVWQEIFELLENKMARGELIVMDATHTSAKSFTAYKKLSQKYRYRVFAVDFSAVSLESCKQRNEQREEYKKVPNEVLEKMHQNMQNQEIPKFVELIKPEEFDQVLNYKIPDYSHYQKIHHIGDLQGTYKPLEEYFTSNPIKDDELYIFVGDYIDRGKENHLAVQKMLELSDKENVIFIEGNHELYLQQWANEEEVKSKEFNLRTKIQLEEHNVSKKKVRVWLSKLRQLVLYKYAEKTVLVTHGGLSNIPKEILKISAKQCIRGSGEYDDVGLGDDAFARNMGENYYQIHGHRNSQNFPIQHNSQCFNLEGKVEFGGELRIVTLSKNKLDNNGFETIEISNQHGQIKSDQEFEENEGFLKKLKSNAYIKEKSFEGNISSFNFSKQVFYKKIWNSQTVTARGLFLNTKTKEIVIRSYNKFFNLNENEENSISNLKKNLVFPLKIWVKENGYLGLVGYNAEFDELVFASKSRLDNDFADWLKNQFYKKLKEKEVEEIKNFLKNRNCCLVFEVIEPKNDPHIIEYQQEKLVLLDIIKRQETFETLNEKEREEFAEKFGFEVKKRALEIHNLADFEKWIEEINQFDYTYLNEYLEGFVVEDDEGFQFKIKLGYYVFWKQMRSLVEKYVAGKTVDLSRFEGNLLETAEKFYRFISKFDKEKLQDIDLISLRNEFEIE